ncbi:MAG: hypothetical protein ACI4KG_02290 [Oscillospiraceae bacterium]
MADNDEYYGSDKARETYSGLYKAYRQNSLADDEISEKITFEIPDNEYFNSCGIYNYYGGGNIRYEK